MFRSVLRKSVSVSVALKKKCATFVPPPLKVQAVGSVPPFIARVGVVGASVALASPLFAMSGATMMWFSYLPKSFKGKVFKYGLAIIAGGGFTQAFYTYICPFFANNADFLLPFALANGLAASFWYTVGELKFGAAAMTQRIGTDVIEKNVSANWAKTLLSRVGSLGLPVAGPVIGFLTAITVPFLWPLLFRKLWGKDLQELMKADDGMWLSTLYEMLLIPVALPVSIASGVAMQFTLTNVVKGVEGKPWTRTTAPVLAALVAAAGLYFTLCRSEPDANLWYRRMDPKTGGFRSYNARTGQYIHDNGVKGKNMTIRRANIAAVAALPRDLMCALHLGTHAIVDDLDHPTQSGMALNRAIEPTGSANSLLRQARSYKPHTDGHRFSIKHINADAQLHKLIDMFVRCKYLQLQGMSTSDITQDAALVAQCQDLGINTEYLLQIVAGIEEDIVLMRTNASVVARVRGTIVNLVKENPEYGNHKHVTALHLLLNNTTLLEQAYSQELNVTINAESVANPVMGVGSSVVKHLCVTFALGVFAVFLGAVKASCQ